MESDRGTFKPEGFSFVGSDEARKMIVSMAAPLALIDAAKIFTNGGDTDIGVLGKSNVPMLALLDDETKYFWYHHTEADTMDKLNPHELSACAAAMAVYLLLVRASDPRYTTLAVVGRTYPIAAGVLTCGAVVAHDGFPGLHASGAWAGILALALVSQLFGHTAINAAVRGLSATFVAMTVLLEPLVAAIAAAIVFGEHPAPFTAAGALLVLGAIALALRAETPAPPLSV